MIRLDSLQKKKSYWITFESINEKNTWEEKVKNQITEAKAKSKVLYHTTLTRCLSVSLEALKDHVSLRVLLILKLED